MPLGEKNKEVKKFQMKEISGVANPRHTDALVAVCMSEDKDAKEIKISNEISDVLTSINDEHQHGLIVRYNP